MVSEPLIGVLTISNVIVSPSGSLAINVIFTGTSSSVVIKRSSAVGGLFTALTCIVTVASFE